MSQNDTAVLFAGQGKLGLTGFACSEEVRPYLADIFSQIDEVATSRSGTVVSDLIQSVSGGIFDPSSTVGSKTLSLTIFGASIATYRFLVDEVGEPTVLLGHGLGELAALVCAGSISVADGAHIICERADILQQLDETTGGMAVLETGGSPARRLIGRLGSEYVCVAGENSPVETVISGRKRELEAVAQLAAKDKIRYRRLRSPYALHCWALMHDASHTLATAISSIPARTPQVPVYSSWLDRYYRGNDPIALQFASYLARPFRFADAIWQLCHSGIQTYVECGALSGISRHVTSTISRNTAPVMVQADLMTSSLPELEPVQRSLTLVHGSSSFGRVGFAAGIAH